MKIYIMRHGDADWRPEGIRYDDDNQRPLTKLGRQEVATMAQLLDRLGVEPDLIFSSPLVRAWQTAEIVNEHFGSKVGVVTAPDMAPGGSLAGVLAQILREGRPAETVLTGHVPDVGMLAGFLAWNQRDSTIFFPTAGVCRIDLPDDNPAPGSGDLRWLIPPRVGERLLRAGD